MTLSIKNQKKIAEHIAHMSKADSEKLDDKVSKKIDEEMSRF